MTTAAVDLWATSPPHAAAPPRARYRADIDGLRALAVAAVILTHAGVGGFRGGFVGVDVFFVISGYLIHRDLLRRLAEGRLSFAGFYGRRLRRTLPALFVTCAATLVAATLVLMPGDLDEMARSLVGAVLLVPNIVFLTQTGYFDQAAAAKPLLHTWSLGVEEQFYLFAPLLALTLVRLRPPWRKTVFLVLIVAALGFTIALQAAAPSAAFYLMPARAFELMIGVALAEPLVPPVRAPWVAEAAAALGLAGLATSIAVFSDALPHPGWPTLLPCLSGAAIIHVGRDRATFVGRVLGLRVPAFLGLISYSLYLWHWPILVLARYADLPQSAAWLVGEAILLLALSVASWRFVEQPFRRAGSPWQRRAPVLIPVAGAALVAGSVAIVAMQGLPRRFPPDVASVAAYYDYRDQKPFREGQCFITSKDTLADFDRGTCLAMAADKPNVLLLGDSHAAHLWTGLRDTWPGVNFLQATASGCKPVLGTTGASRCTTLMDDMLKRFVPTHRLDAVAIGGLWDVADIQPLVRTVAALRPFAGQVVVFGPMPRYDQPLATLLAKGLEHGDLAGVRRHLVPGTADLDARMRAALAPVARYVSTYEAMCTAGSCRLFVSAGIPMQFDYHHLTVPGAAAMMARIRQDNAGLFVPQRSTSNR